MVPTVSCLGSESNTFIFSYFYTFIYFKIYKFNIHNIFYTKVTDLNGKSVFKTLDVWTKNVNFVFKKEFISSL